jgi:hypothetical protein
MPSCRRSSTAFVDGVNALEMEALKLGNGFVPKEEDHAGRGGQRRDLRG